MTNHEIWLNKLEGEKTKPYFQNILSLVKEDKKQYVVAPDREDWLRALEFPNIDDIKVIITDSKSTVPSYSQDGLAWSSMDLPSKDMLLLYNKIYKDTNMVYDQTNHQKDRWVKQGVLLLNMELTTSEGKSKEDITTLWEPFTISVLEYFLQSQQPRAFILLDESTKWHYLPSPHQHLIIEESIRGKQKPIFKVVNNFIEQHYGVIIDWT